MSDPVPNVEIEDVLSSIRRLVSADERDENAEEQHAESRRAEASRLVLTPAQRVDDRAAENDGPKEEVTEPEDVDTGADPTIDAPASSSVEDRLSEIEDVEIAEPQEENAAAPEPESLEEDIPVFLRHRAHDENRQAIDAHLAGNGDDTAGTSEAAAEDIAYDADGDTGQSDIAFDAEDDDGGEPSHEMGEDDATEVDLQALQARIAGFETAVAEQEDEWEPDGVSDDEYAGAQVSPLPWKDDDHDGPADAKDPVSGFDAAEASQDDESGAGGTWFADDAIIDEEALRDMVSEIVRQELQGALGERITRNVRKLVRREIHRALMSQGID